MWLQASSPSGLGITSSEQKLEDVQGVETMVEKEDSVDVLTVRGFPISLSCLSILLLLATSGAEDATIETENG